MLDPSAEAAFLELSNILQVDQSGSQDALVRGSLGRKLNIQWYMDQNVQTVTPGTGWVTGWAASTASAAVGDTTINLINATAAGTIVVGDLFAVGGNDYVVTVAATASATVARLVTFTPALKTAVDTGAAITVVGAAYTNNLVLHRDAMAWASRPLSDLAGVGNLITSQVDPKSGVALRLEVSRQFKQTTYSFDVLGGSNIIRAALGGKLLG